MLRSLFLVPLFWGYQCAEPNVEIQPQILKPVTQTARHAAGTWPAFLQSLPIQSLPVTDYRGRPVPFQQKAMGVIPYDVGTADLQQCADALMRLRAEYLFAQKRYSEISFRFTSGHAYSYLQYCAGWRPRFVGNKVGFVQGAACSPSAKSLRAYLNIIYAYAGTISLHRDLKPVKTFSIGTIIITPGSPGHCCIIIDEAIDGKGKSMYKLAESYTPAQSIYVLRNTAQPDLGAWHYLTTPGQLVTASYVFETYSLRSFE